MWCPKCEKITTCKAVSPREVNRFVPSSRRFYKQKHDDVQFFRRGRICLACRHKFLSAEARETFLTELVELRDALAVIKRDAEQYITDSQQTSKSLTSLNDSLGKLRALKIYQKQEPAAPPPSTTPPTLEEIEEMLKKPTTLRLV